MRNRLYIIALLAVGMLTATGCANKKKIAMQQQAELQRQQDSIAQAQALALAEAEARERQRVQDSIAEAEAKAAQIAMVQTMNISRLTLTISAQGKQLTTPASMRWQRGTGTVISIQPLGGIEMFRIEQDANAVTVIDKINRRYTRLSMDDLARMGAPTTQEEIDAWIDKNILEHRDEPQLVLQVSQAGINGSAVIYTNTIQTNGNVNLRPTNIDMYKQVTPEQMIRGL